jgi:serine/threonine-protein kinase
MFSQSRSRPRPAPELPERYRVERPLAGGGMGSVWRGSDTALDREVAIKLLSEAFVGDYQAVRRFMREARAAARLSSHPNVVTIYDVGEFAEQPYIVMEYLGGGTVAEAIAHEDVTHELALRWLEQAGSALDHAHGRGIVHRDVKPSNMLLGDDGDLRLADFGIASLVAEQTISRTGQLLGTAAYISPEQARGLPATEASDRYALAVTAFELLAGRRPFEGEHFAAQARAHMEQPPPRASDYAPGLSRAVDGVLQRGMAKAAVDRWPTALDFTDALRAAIARPASSPHAFAPPALMFAKPKGSPRERAAGRPGPRGRAARLPALAALALAVVTIGIVVESNSGPPVAARTVLRESASRLSDAATFTAAGAAATSAGRIAASLAKAGELTSAVHRPAPPQPAATTGTTAAPPAQTATTAAPAGATALEAEGHGLMESGSYAQALAVLRQAVATADPSSLTYAYALFDLGRTLRLAGDPQAAIPILEQRLQIPNQPGVVANELNLAEQQAGQSGPGPGPDHGNGHAYGHDKHPGGDQGNQFQD